MRQLVGTTKGCPISQLYLEMGHTPARFGIMKLRLNFLKTILEQEKSSLIYKFFNTQNKNPIKSDWASTCKSNLKEMNINISFSEIEKMTVKEYKKMIKTNCDKLAFEYLMKKKGSKGKEIIYTNLQMSQYLQPNNHLEITEQKKIFELRNRMTNIPGNYGNQTECECGMIENMEHIYINANTSMKTK